MWVHIILLSALCLLNGAMSHQNVETLPGFSGTLPSKLETGYISVGDFDEIQLFYYFFESEGNAEKDPLFFWFNGGPGCSGLSSFSEKTAPLIFDDGSLFTGSLPTLLENPYSFSKVANVIFSDALPYVGFSYATTNEGYHTSDTKAAKDDCTFIRKWLLDHPEFDKNPLYIGGDSYGGLFVPMIVTFVSEGGICVCGTPINSFTIASHTSTPTLEGFGVLFWDPNKRITANNLSFLLREDCTWTIEAGHMTNTNLHGYILGNPMMDPINLNTFRLPYANHMALISDYGFESAKSSCHGDYSSRDPSNAKCLLALEPLDKCLEDLNVAHILEPKCLGYPRLKKQDELKWWKQSPEEMIILPSKRDDQPKLCLQGTLTTEWIRCNKSFSGYVYDVENVMEYHQILSKKEYRALVYSGDHDIIVPYTDTLAWIHKLNLSTDERWRPWFVDHQVAGYTENYRGNNGVSLTFATVKGAGHIATTYNPKEVFAMIERWFSRVPL